MTIRLEHHFLEAVRESVVNSLKSLPPDTPAFWYSGEFGVRFMLTASELIAAIQRNEIVLEKA